MKLNDHDDDDDGLQYHQVSALALVDLRKLVLSLAASQADIESPPEVTTSSVATIHARLDLFQEDPVLLDPLLKELLPPLADRYLDLLRRPQYGILDNRTRAWCDAIGKTLYQFCKVRGAKIVTRFMNNEPRWVAPMLKAYESLSCSQYQSDELSGTALSSGSLGGNFPIGSWQERYICLLWLGHLMYAPFDLATLSDENEIVASLPALKGSAIEERLPQAARKAIVIGLESLFASDIRQAAAAALLTRIVVRPDMRKLGLPDALMKWASEALKPSNLEICASIHQYVGTMTFINSTISTADVSDTCKFLKDIHQYVLEIFGQGVSGYEALVTSAIGKKMAIKIQRNIIMKIWNAQVGTVPDTMPLLEDTIDFLLNALADRDTQVRRAASKALSMIASKIDAVMAEEVVEAVIGSMNEDVLPERGGKSLQAVNPLRWHGLTLTLAQMLFRRQPLPSQLPDILTALFRALSFEQRSAAGSSVGGNVRDAANFGLWSLARRYTTEELRQVAVSSLTKFAPNHVKHHFDSVLPLTASHLIVSACTDSVGNVRRGSSAALQELIGRHPDTIPNGIPLVQIVDYHAVGLHRRAMTRIACEAAKRNAAYLNYLIDALLSWRGSDSVDKSSRETAAESLGRLTTLLSDADASSLIQLVRRHLGFLRMPAQEVEQRHGLFFALATCIDAQVSVAGPDTIHSIMGILEEVEARPYALKAEDFQSMSAKPELTAAGATRLYQSMLRACVSKPAAEGRALSEAGKEVVLHSLTLALAHVSEPDYPLASTAVSMVGEFCAANDLRAIVKLWLTRLHDSRRLFRGPALMLAAGTIWHHLGHDVATKQSIIDELIRSAGARSDVDTRVLAVRSLGYIVDDRHLEQHMSEDQVAVIFDKIHESLNDYTTNERGDVGSLLRSEALHTLRNMPMRWSAARLKVANECLWSTYRLAVERLHKLRVEAYLALQARGIVLPSAQDGAKQHSVTISHVSTSEYFARLAALATSNPVVGYGDGESVTERRFRLITALVEGFASSAGVGNESVLDNSRCALVIVLNELPIHDANRTTLLDVGNALSGLLRDSLSVERVLVPVLELIAFLLDANTLQPLLLHATSYKWRTLLAYVQKSHFKSSSVPKLLVCISIYRSLAQVPEVQRDVIIKLVGMLSHPFPRIREAVVEALWVATNDEELKRMETTQTPLTKASADALKGRYVDILA